MYEISSPVKNGRIISVWSPVSRQGAVSTNAAFISSYIAKMGESTFEKTLLICTDAQGMAKASNYLSKERIIDGLAEVIELSISENLKTPNDIYKNTFSISDSIDVLSCSKNNTNVVDFLAREITPILEMAKKSYRYIVIDTNCGLFDPATLKILANSDIVVASLPQDKVVFDAWLRKMPEVYPMLLSNKPTILLSAKHCEFTAMKYATMSKELKGETLYYISLNDRVHEAVSRNKVYQAVIEELKKKNPDDFILELQAIWERIQDILEVLLEEELAIEESQHHKQRKINRQYLKDNSMHFDSDLYTHADEDDEIYPNFPEKVTKEPVAATEDEQLYQNFTKDTLYDGQEEIPIADYPYPLNNAPDESGSLVTEAVAPTEIS